ncbi:MAG: hypothetical protein KF878_10965 [Planctomycetes bacterium]|nr:hypothetical protein [Planctomycetota bacterium]
MVRAAIEPEESPARQGLRMALSLSITNDGPHLLVLDEAAGDDPLDERLRWRRHPDGMIVYDAGDDVYRHHSVVAARASIPLCHLVIAPGGTGRTFYSARSLAVGPRRARVRVTGHLVPLDDVGLHLYESPERMHGPSTVYRPVSGDPSQVGGVVIARCGRVPTFEAVAEVDLVVEADPSAEDALERGGPGAALIERPRRLGGAWVVEGADGAVTLTDGARAVRCPPGLVDPAVWRRLDDAPPSAPLLVMFRSDPARALRDAGALPLHGLDTAQQTLPPAALWDLLAGCEARRLTVRWGRHSGTSDGLVVT